MIMTDKEKNEQLFLDERKVLLGLMSPNNMELSKSIITLSTFSLGYILYNTSSITNKTLVIGTCALFLLTILLVMLSFLLGSRSLEKQIQINEEYYLEDGVLKPPWEKKIVVIISWVICFTFISGLILVCLCYLNLPIERSK